MLTLHQIDGRESRWCLRQACFVIAIETNVGLFFLLLLLLFCVLRSTFKTFEGVTEIMLSFSPNSPHSSDLGTVIILEGKEPVEVHFLTMHLQGTLLFLQP